MERVASGVGSLIHLEAVSEISSGEDYDMTSMLTLSQGPLGFAGFYDSYAWNNNGSWVNQSPLTAWSRQWDDGNGSLDESCVTKTGNYCGNYFAQGSACGPTAYLGQEEPFGQGSGGYGDGLPYTKCVGFDTTLPGS
jgi:hypothetical protein